MTRESIDLKKVDWPAVADRRRSPAEHPFLPFHVAENQTVPDFLPIGADRIVRQTSSTHGQDGYITLDSGFIQRNQDRLRCKLSEHVKEFTFYEADAQSRATTLLIVYGVTCRAAKVAIRRLRKMGERISMLALKTLWPVPEALLGQTMADVTRVVVVEMNMGQYVREVERLSASKKVSFFGQMNGTLITPDQIIEAVAS